MSRKPFSFLFLFSLSLLVLGACQRERRAVNKTGATVLVLIDYQEDFLDPNGRMPIASNQIEPMLKATNEMVAAARGQLVPVVYTMAEHTPFDMIGNVTRHYAAMRYESGSTLDPRVDSYAGVYFTKSEPGAFTNPQFEAHLQVLDCGRLVIAGVYANRAVIATAKQAIARGYRVTVISDAIGAATEEQRDAALGEMKKDGVQIESSTDFIASLSAGSEEKKAG